MALIVQKFGGSSLATVDHLNRVAQTIVATKQNGNQVAVVVSAMGGHTDQLLDLASKLSPAPPGSEQDALLATGEQASAALLAIALEKMGCRARSLLGFQLPLITDDNHTKARILDLPTATLEKILDLDIIPVVAGFQGITKDGSITTLGRGGSDTTAVALAAALKADRCEIFTDVDGVYTADPNICPGASHLPKVSYQEMLELASMGAKVLHSRSVELAQKFQVPLVVKSSFGSERVTWIVNEEAVMENSIIKGITLERNTSKISVIRVPDRPGIAYRILSPLADAAIIVDMIIQNASIDGFTDFTFTVAKTDLAKAKKLVEEVALEINALEVLTDNQVVKVSAVGIGIKTNPAVAARMFQSLSEENINIQMISTSEYRISCAIEEKYGELAVRALHRAFKLEKPTHI
ncbi:MAG TPA: aspartate kinase [Candidatus Limnocylindrales bacterium]|nr:aspartate kinase [Candidatus Limnocylindrales bacterium]